MATKKKETKKKAAETPKESKKGTKEVKSTSKKKVEQKDETKPSIVECIPVDTSAGFNVLEDDPNMKLFERINAEFGDYLIEHNKCLYTSDIQVAWVDFTGIKKYSNWDGRVWSGTWDMPADSSVDAMDRFIDIVHSRPDWKILMYRTFDPAGEMDYDCADGKNTKGYKVRDYFTDTVLKRNKTIPESVLERYADKLDWNLISTFQDLSENQIKMFEDRVNWVLLSTYTLMSEQFLYEHRDRIDWSAIPSTKTGQELSEKFIRDFSDYLNWVNIGVYSQLSESFMDVFADRLNWKNISAYQKLSDDFIYRHREEVDWDLIFRYQTLSVEMLDKCMAYRRASVHSDALFKYQQYNDEFLIRHFDSFNWSQINPFCSKTLQRAQKMHWEIIIKPNKFAEGTNILDLMTEEDVCDPQTIEYGVPIHFIERMNTEFIDWDVVSMYRLPADFIEHHRSFLNPLLIRYNNDLSNGGKLKKVDSIDVAEQIRKEGIPAQETPAESRITQIIKRITETIKSWFSRN